MGYKVEKPEGAPSWYKSGIKCQVRDYDSILSTERTIVWFENGCFIASDGSYWRHATPIESWEPVEDEWVAAWDDEWEVFFIAKYDKRNYDGERFNLSDGVYDHIARITDGLDLRCTPEELKERTDWL